MADVGQVSLGAVRIQAQQKADLLNAGFITTVEWNQMLSLSYKSLFDLLGSTYGSDYFCGPPYTFVTNSSTQLYALPDGSTTIDSVTGLAAAPLYKLIGVEIQQSPTSWITLKRFEFIDRNKYWLANTLNAAGGTNLRYKIVGNNLWLTTYPSAGYSVRLWYIPKPTNLQPVVTVTTTSSSATVTCSDTTQLAVGMNVSDYVVLAGASAVIPPSATITAITPNTSFTLSAAAAASKTNLLAAAWSDQTTFDGIAGWEEYVSVDSAIKALLKEESDPSTLIAYRQDLVQRIVDNAPNRDSAEAPTVTDAAGLDALDDMGSGGYGSNW